MTIRKRTSIEHLTSVALIALSSKLARLAQRLHPIPFTMEPVKVSMVSDPWDYHREYLLVHDHRTHNVNGQWVRSSHISTHPLVTVAVSQDVFDNPVVYVLLNRRRDRTLRVGIDPTARPFCEDVYPS